MYYRMRGEMTIISGDKVKGKGLRHRVKVKAKAVSGIGGKHCKRYDCPDNDKGRCKIFGKGMRCDMKK
jgi:hypothetical protein